MGKPAAFLDRDGTIFRLIHRPGFRIRGKLEEYTAAFDVREVELVDGAEEAVKILQQKGYAVIIITNQPDVHNGFMSELAADRIVTLLYNKFPGIQGYHACMHGPDEGCACRKPKPGLILTAAERYDIDLGRSVMIGDMETDVLAGRSAGVGKTFLITDEKRESTADVQVTSMIEAAHRLPHHFDGRNLALNPDQFETLYEQIAHEYTYGDCYYLAKAMREKTGWPLAGIFGNQTAGSILHTGVRDPLGQYWDIRGPVSEEEFKNTFILNHPEMIFEVRIIFESELEKKLKHTGAEIKLRWAKNIMEILFPYLPTKK